VLWSVVGKISSLSHIVRREKLITRGIRVTARVGLVGTAIVGLASVRAAAQESAQPPPNIFGTYGRSSAGRDSIRVLKRTNGRIGLIIKLYYSNGHTCQLNADGEWHDAHVVVTAEGLDPSRPCKLNAFFGDGRVSLKDDGLQCAPVYCGSRGKLDDVSLSKVIPNRK
jgi:hypothetical protein